MKENPEKLTRREEELMRCFWEHGPLFVRELVALSPDPKPHFNTLSTMVRALDGAGRRELDVWNRVRPGG